MALPFEYGSFDIAGCVRVLHHVRRPGARRVGARPRDAAGRPTSPRRPARLRRSPAQPRARPLRAHPRPHPHAAPSGCRHPRVPRRERPRPDRVGDPPGDRGPRAASRARARFRRTSASAFAASRRAQSTRSRSAGTSPGSRRRARTRRGAPSSGRPSSRRGPGREHRRSHTSRYGNHGTVTSRLFFSTADTTALATSSGSITNRRRSGLRSFVRWGKPSVSTKPGITVCTRMPLPRSSAVVERENASWACFEAAYAPAGANATVPATETMLTTCAPPSDAAARSPGMNARRHHRPPR